MAHNTSHLNVQQSFESFFQGWLLRQQNFLEQLLSISLTPDSPLKIHHQNALIDQVLSHYHQYFLQKSRLADADVFLLFSPTWLSSYERALLWIADYKPSLLLRLVDGAVQGLTPDQDQDLHQLKEDTRREERILTGIMAAVQESLAGPSILQVARQVGRLLDGEIGELDSAMEVMKRAMTEVLEKADQLRVTTAKRVVEILSPSQTVQFLAAAAEFQLRVRRWGMERDSRGRQEHR
ncbi:protein DOG1-like 4 [Senna tora]|uniref:Protein DOG1-like 4 n=1 Tax=Senna tora TaxID=362788 RepID=A0A834TGR8_9FABA|nr:protein DOG1-like 4 [Senna tora]